MDWLSVTFKANEVVCVSSIPSYNCRGHSIVEIMGMCLFYHSTDDRIPTSDSGTGWRPLLKQMLVNSLVRQTVKTTAGTTTKEEVDRKEKPEIPRQEMN